MGLSMVRCSLDALSQILRGTGACVTNAPDDMEAVGVIETPLDREHREIQVVCRSSKWPDSMEGAVMPGFELIFTRVD